jgi:radical SAM superfamily enzyme YgiQ (UPF0313 family)
MLLYLINPTNPLVSLAKSRENHWNRYTAWKPLGLLVLAGLTPKSWDIKIFDENLSVPDYGKLPKPDLVGLTAFTSQAGRAYAIAAGFRARNVPVVMGGIHASMRAEEAGKNVDAVVCGEAESIWTQVLSDVEAGSLKKIYKGDHRELDCVPAARHDLLPKGYFFGSIQISRGCPLSCSFCSVTAFNGGHFRRRPIDDVVKEFKLIKEKHILIVDDNLIGTRSDQVEHTKELFRKMIAARLNKRWIAQVTINMADDDELLRLAAKAGCYGVFIGFESATKEGLTEVHKKFNFLHNRDMKASIRRIQRRGINVVGSFIMGLDIDKKHIGRDIAASARRYGLDALNVMFLTPLPGTNLWDRMLLEDRITANDFPNDWKYYTLTFPVAKYMHLTWSDMLREKDTCYRNFYSYPHILKRASNSLWHRRNPFVTLATNMVFRINTLKFDRKTYSGFDVSRGHSHTHTPDAITTPCP